MSPMLVIIVASVELLCPASSLRGLTCSQDTELGDWFIQHSASKHQAAKCMAYVERELEALVLLVGRV
jgi:hypothetical protein